MHRYQNCKHSGSVSAQLLKDMDCRTSFWATLSTDNNIYSYWSHLCMCRHKRFWDTVRHRCIRFLSVDTDDQTHTWYPTKTNSHVAL